MATLVLSAAGAAIGGSVGGSVLGLSMAAVGRFAGAVIGRSIDQRLLGKGSDVIETGRVNRLRLTGAGEGDAVSRVFGRIRVPGHVIWATEFLQTVSESGGGKGGPPKPKQRSYSYSISLAVALCEGEIADIGRIWADGIEVAKDTLNMRVYTGSDDQLPDPKMEAVEGAGTVPAYRGTAYVVFEDLDLSAFGNRVPQFNFEVIRPAPKTLPGADLDPAHAMQGVAMLPGSGEYALATTPVRLSAEGDVQHMANVNSASNNSDFRVSLDSLSGELPNCGAVSLIVSWFGDDLRCSDCTIRPKVGRANEDGQNMPWQVAGLKRDTALEVSRDPAGEPVYGGTPTDQSVIEAIRALNQSGREVMYYPFILMDQAHDNTLPDPYSDAGQQAPLPWRGRITTSKAPGQEGSPDGTAAAASEVDLFFGTASAADFTITDVEFEEPDDDTPFDPLTYTGTVKSSPVTYSGPAEWSYRRFILHQAALCQAAGGVESFCIGSEMRGLTQIRREDNGFPAVVHLMALAAEVRSILGPDVKLTYAADWSEYFGYAPQDGGGDRFFHLDPLWADDNIDFIGIDNYMRLSDWRDGEDHADADWGSIHNLDYLMANVEGGEGYDWFYATDNDREFQNRTPITDEAHEEPWIWRYKDIRSWWSNPHHDRVGGVRMEDPTVWAPQSKPIRFTEYGCAAVDKGTNQPNKFIDPKSSESSLPHFSNGLRDDLNQFQYLRAIAGYWTDPANNPVSEEYGAPMVDMDHAYAWAWDARPYPAFPNTTGLWSDGDNYLRGHWITGRMASWRLSSVIEAVCQEARLDHCDTDGLHGLVRGYQVDQVTDARAILQPLSTRFGFDAVERGGALRFRLRDGLADFGVDPDQLVRAADMDGPLEETRSSEVELAGRVRLRFVEADADYDVVSEEASLPDDSLKSVSGSEIPLVMTRAEGRRVAERWLAESRVARDSVTLTLPRSRLSVGAGDVITLPEEGGVGHFRVDQVDMMAHAQKLEAIRVEPENYRPVPFEDKLAQRNDLNAPGIIAPFFLDLPLLTGEEVPHAPHIAVTGSPWPGSAAVYSSGEDADYTLEQVIERRTPIGITEGVLQPASSGLIDRGAALRVRMLNGRLETLTTGRFLKGGNTCAIGDGTPGNWEVMQFRDARMVDRNTYELSHRLRGQLGTERAEIWPDRSYIVMLDGSAQQLELMQSQLGLERHYRVGPGTQAIDSPAFVHAVLSFDGIGLRPLSPVHLRLAGAPGGTRTARWVRRTRIDGDRWGRFDVPLGEEVEQYMVRVRQAGVTLREEIVTQPQWAYTAAMQAGDGLSGAFDLEVAQLSGSFGPGRFARLNLVA